MSGERSNAAHRPRARRGRTARAAALVATAVAVVTVALGALFLGQGGESPDRATPAGAETDSAPLFHVSLYQGAGLFDASEVDFRDVLALGVPVVLNFWAADCPPCRAEMPWLDDAAVRFEGEVVVFGVDVGVFTGLGTNERGRRLLQDLGVRYPAGAAVDARPLERYGIRGMPSTVFFAADGRQVRVHTGIMTAGQIDAAIAELVATR